MKKNSVMWFVAVIAVTLLVNLLPNLGDDLAFANPSSEKIATVNGSPVAKEDFVRIMNQIKKQFSTANGQELKDAQLASVKQQVIDSLINNEILYQDSKKQGIKLEDSFINKQFEEAKKKSPPDFNADSLKAQVTRNLYVQQLIEKHIAPNAKISDEDVKKFYNDNPAKFQKPESIRASHILINVAPNASNTDKAKALDKMKDIESKVKKGGDFSALAKANSDCASKANGGDVGYFTRGKMVKQFEDAAFKLKSTGDISEIIETQFGYHLIKLTDKKSASLVSFDEAKDKLKQYLQKRKLEDEVKKYAENLRKSAKVEILPVNDKK